MYWGSTAMAGAPVPEVAVDEHRDPRAAQQDVDQPAAVHQVNPLQRRVLQDRAVEPVTDNLAGENHRILAEREVLVPDGIWGRPGLV
jgi:hypothetical protein